VHPNRIFAWEDREAMLAFVRDLSFTHLFVQSPAGPLVAHVPVLVTPEGNLRFHLARANPVSKCLGGAVALASFSGADAYISPDWYGSADQVPTWNYVTVEARGPVHRLDAAGLIANVDELSAEHEARLLPKKPWTRRKMRQGLFEGMLKSIIGFELTVDSLRGTRKLGQNKSVEDLQGALEGLTSVGKRDMGELMLSEKLRVVQ